MKVKLRPGRYAYEKICKRSDCERVGQYLPASEFGALAIQFGGGTVDVCKACVGKSLTRAAEARRAKEAAYQEWKRNGGIV